MGSGTTAIASIEEKRNFIGSEISKRYFEIANNRIDNFVSAQKLF
jgi:site-specific DNA-methyltransferase (adenine-specific)